MKSVTCKHGVDDGACKECYEEQTKQEPVAWMQVNDKKNVTKLSLVKTWEDDIPLYTEPQYRELSDEEINEVYNKIYEMNHMDLVTAFARAILKKASEK